MQVAVRLLVGCVLVALVTLGCTARDASSADANSAARGVDVPDAGHSLAAEVQAVAADTASTKTTPSIAAGLCRPRCKTVEDCCFVGPNGTCTAGNDFAGCFEGYCARNSDLPCQAATCGEKPQKIQPMGFGCATGAAGGAPMCMALCTTAADCCAGVCEPGPSGSCGFCQATALCVAGFCRTKPCTPENCNDSVKPNIYKKAICLGGLCTKRCDAVVDCCWPGGPCTDASASAAWACMDGVCATLACSKDNCDAVPERSAAYPFGAGCTQ